MSFPARYPGECSDCDHQIRPGDEIASDGLGGQAHVFCPSRTPASSAVPCTRCFLVHAGECFP